MYSICILVTITFPLILCLRLSKAHKNLGSKEIKLQPLNLKPQQKLLWLSSVLL